MTERMQRDCIRPQRATRQVSLTLNRPFGHLRGERRKSNAPPLPRFFVITPPPLGGGAWGGVVLARVDVVQCRLRPSHISVFPGVEIVRWVIDLPGAAPCQWRSPAGTKMRSPTDTRFSGWPSTWTIPSPAVTNRT